MQGNLIVYYENHFFRSASRHEGVPELTAKQVAALDYFAALADSQELRMDYVLQRGDIQLLHNHSIVHARTAYIDHDEVSVEGIALHCSLLQEDLRTLLGLPTKS